MTISEVRQIVDGDWRHAKACLSLLTRTEADPRYLTESPLLGGEFEDSASIGMVLAVEVTGEVTVLDRMNQRNGGAVIRRRRPDCRFGPVCRTDEGTWFLTRETPQGAFDGFRPRAERAVVA